MRPFTTRALPVAPDLTAPDGAQVRLLSDLAGGSMAHFELAPGQSSMAVTHRTVEEIWYVLSGKGQMWRHQDGDSSITDLEAGISLTIPLGTHFQFRNTGPTPFTAVAVTMPPWPGDGEAVPVAGEWTPSPPTPPPAG